MKRIITYLVEAVTAGSFVFLACGIDSHALCVITSIFFLLLLCVEIAVWEGGV